MIKRQAGRFYAQILFIAILSLLIRIAYFDQTSYEHAIRGDAQSYVHYAYNLVTHGIFSSDRNGDLPIADSFRPPGYPAVIAIALLAENHFALNAYDTLMYVNIVLGTLTAIITFLLGRIFLSQFYACVAAVFVALSPHMVAIGGLVLTETLFSFLLMAALYCYVSGFTRYNGKWLAASGLLFGFCYLVNPVIFFTPLLLLPVSGFIFVKKKAGSWRSFTRMVMPCLLIFSLVASLWFARNLVSVPAGQADNSSRLFVNLVIGTHSNFFETYRKDDRDSQNPATLDMASLDGSYGNLAQLLSGRMANDPLHYAKWYFIDKPVLLWSWNILVGSGDIFVYPVIVSLYHRSQLAAVSYFMMKHIHYWLFGFALMGIYFAVKKGDKNEEIPIFLYLVLVYISSVYVITQAEARYSIPLRPEMYLCAVFFISRFMDKIQTKEKILIPPDGEK